jgi:hypothetical protein
VLRYFQPRRVKHLGIHGIAAPLLRLQYFEKTCGSEFGDSFIRHANICLALHPALSQGGAHKQFLYLV